MNNTTAKESNYYRRKDGKRYLMITHATGGISVVTDEQEVRESNMELGSMAALKLRLENYEPCTAEVFAEARDGKLQVPCHV